MAGVRAGQPLFWVSGTNNIAYRNVIEGWISKLANSLGVMIEAGTCLK